MKISHVLSVSTLVAVLSGCSGSTEDVQSTLCKSMAAHMTASPETVVWTNKDVKMVRFEDMEVKLDFKVAEADGTLTTMQATCFYDYEVHQEENQIGVDIYQNYSTNPHKMVMNNQSVPQTVLTDAIHKAMLQQGKDALKIIQNTAESAINKAKEAAQAVEQKSTEYAK